MIFHRRTPEDWHIHLRSTSNPRELANTLRSRRNFRDKVKILLAMPSSCIRNTVDMLWLESKLQDSRHAQLAQVVRWLLFGAMSEIQQCSLLTYSHHIVEADIRARWVVQREIYLNGEVQALRKYLALSVDREGQPTASQLQSYEKELELLGGNYMDCCQTDTKLESNLPNGVLGRTFRETRKDPNWYLCEWLRQDCAGRGGCCERKCGCCEKARNTNRAKWTHGHCTSACGCCIRTLGRDGMVVKRDDYMRFPLHVGVALPEYVNRVNRAYIWGVSFVDEFGLDGYHHSSEGHCYEDKPLGNLLNHHDNPPQ